MSLHDLVLDYQQNNSNYSIETLLSKFNPLLLKYSIRFFDSSNSHSELILHFIKTIKSIPIHKEPFSNDKYIISYINTSIKHFYYSLYANEQKYLNNNILISTDSDFNTFTIEDEDSTIFDYLSKYLSPKELLVITKHYKYLYRDSEIASELNVSRQNIYITRKRALKKLKKYLV